MLPGDERRHLALLLVLFVLLGIFVLFHRERATGSYEVRIAQLEEDVAFEQRFSDELFEQNKELRSANVVLRDRVLELTGNVTQREQLVQACLARNPALGGQNVSEPRHRVNLQDLTFTQSAVVVNVRDIMPGVVSSSTSMFPLLHENTIVLEVTPKSAADIYVGDIIIYERAGVRIIHRVVAIGWDEQGWFAMTRGDNNPVDDPFPVRLPEIRGIVVGIIY